MNIFQDLITAYIHANAALGAGALASLFLLIAIRHSFISPLNSRKLAHSIILFIFLLPGLLAFLPGKNLLSPTTQIWSAPSMQEFSSFTSSSDIESYNSIDVLNGSHMASYHSIAWIIAVCVLLGVCTHSIRMVLNGISIRRILKNAHLFRRIGKVRLYASGHTSTPFSIRLPGRSIVVIPDTVIGASDTFSISVAHELHHHRQGDTLWVYALLLVKAFFLWNPFVYLLENKISELQEMACDEFLVVHRKISPIAYFKCLINVAELARKIRTPLCTMGMPTSLSGKKLKRRINTMFTGTPQKTSPKRTLSCAVACFCFMATISFASQGMIQDKRISMQEATEMANNVAKDFSFPVAVNDDILMQLNCYLGTPDGRTHIRQALDRMDTFREIIENKLSEYDAPTVLLAVPIIESGYRNLPQGEGAYGAGLWQFIQNTARHYGLQVDADVDERLDVEMETDAAIRYLTDNYAKFKDWGLSLLAYNAGEHAVRSGIDATGSDDPWVLIDAGYENDKNYLSKVYAALIIMCNPSSLD